MCVCNVTCNKSKVLVINFVSAALKLVDTYGCLYIFSTMDMSNVNKDVFEFIRLTFLSLQQKH